MAKKHKITEKEVEAIYHEAQRKIKDVPGYSDAFQRFCDQMMKVTQPGYVETEDDRKQLDQALGDLLLIELEEKFLCKSPF